jgi:ABC-2 type transport system permease protein
LKAVIKILTRIVSISPVEDTEFEKKFNQQQIERLITLRIERAGKVLFIPSGFNHTIPAVTIMFILFTLLMYGGITILQERRTGQLERIFLSPASFASIITGKWISRLFLGMAQIATLFLFGKIAFKTYYGNDLIALVLVALFFCGTIAGMSILLGSIIRKEEVLVIINILGANVMAALGGCWFPHELFPPGLRVISFLFPTGWAMDAFHKLIFFGYDLNSVALHIGVLFLFTLIFLALAIKFFKLRKI